LQKQKPQKLGSGADIIFNYRANTFKGTLYKLLHKIFAVIGLTAAITYFMQTSRAGRIINRILKY